MTTFKDYPQEKYDRKVPWYVWLKDQIRKKDTWKQRMEGELLKTLKTCLRTKGVNKNYVEGRTITLKEVLGILNKSDEDILSGEPKK